MPEVPAHLALNINYHFFKAFEQIHQHFKFNLKCQTLLVNDAAVSVKVVNNRKLLQLYHLKINSILPTQTVPLES
jgi:hypothetical protein